MVAGKCGRKRDRAGSRVLGCGPTPCELFGGATKLALLLLLQDC